MALKKAAMAAIKADWNQYPVTFGEPELRNIIAHKVGSITRSNAIQRLILQSLAGPRGYDCDLKAIINPGDEVVVFEPFYENYGPMRFCPERHPNMSRCIIPTGNILPKS